MNRVKRCGHLTTTAAPSAASSETSPWTAIAVPPVSLISATTRSAPAASDAAQQMVARTALGRPGRPDDIARIVAFLASDQSGWLTGERIEASGGYA
jgi:3-oxoacyl-[acyl-carrier protein] reductase